MKEKVASSDASKKKKGQFKFWEVCSELKLFDKTWSITDKVHNYLIWISKQFCGMKKKFLESKSTKYSLLDRTRMFLAFVLILMQQNISQSKQPHLFPPSCVSIFPCVRRSCISLDDECIDEVWLIYVILCGKLWIKSGVEEVRNLGKIRGDKRRRWWLFLSSSGTWARRRWSLADWPWHSPFPNWLPQSKSTFLRFPVS